MYIFQNFPIIGKKFDNFFEDLNPPNPFTNKSLKGVYNLGIQLSYLLLNVHLPELSAGRKKFDDFFEDFSSVFDPAVLRVSCDHFPRVLEAKG
jgi:hypothetical protein